MVTLEALIASLPPSPDLTDIARDLVPPPRFRDERFATYHPRHPSQREAAARLEEEAASLRRPRSVLGGFFRRRGPGKGSTPGIYLDGGFGVGKTHLLAALWNAAPTPSAYLSFDELMYLVGVAGVEGAGAMFRDHHLLAIDEWELDDPGNLKLALAFLRVVLAGRARVVVTSNTLPLDLGAGRFSQKDFRSEIEELAAAFTVLRLEGEDYRQRRYELGPGRRYFLAPDELQARTNSANGGVLHVEFTSLLAGLRQLHPIQYRQLARAFNTLAVEGIGHIASLPDALRWVHFVDSLYDARVRFHASGEIPLIDLFDREAMTGPYAKKLARCLSRMEEMLGESTDQRDIAVAIPRGGQTPASGR